jgi:hypothetical protein
MMSSGEKVDGTMLALWQRTKSAFRVAHSGNAECPVETRSMILPGDRRCQFDELGFGKLNAQLGEQFVVHRSGRPCQGYCEPQGQSLSLGERGALFETRQVL